MGRDHIVTVLFQDDRKFQSTRPVWGATYVSIQPLLVAVISIHAPRVGRDHAWHSDHDHGHKFQSTRPVWGATRETRRRITRQRDFNPRAPCGARPRTSTPPANNGDFNPRAPCGARRFAHTITTHTNHNFNPRAPCGARRIGLNVYPIRHNISIHAPRVGRDVGDIRPGWPGMISIHAPRVGRDLSIQDAHCGSNISIHAPRVGRDPYAVADIACNYQFQSTRPVWGATRGRSPAGMAGYDFNPRAPCGARRQI